MTQRKEGVSPETDALATALLGKALDMLAIGEDELGVLLAVGCEDGSVESFSFADDGQEACLAGAYAQVASVPKALRYAITYEGAVEQEDGFADALLLEFGERGWRAYSAYTLVANKGNDADFAYTDPAPAGEVDPLL